MREDERMREGKKNEQRKSLPLFRRRLLGWGRRECGEKGGGKWNRMFKCCDHGWDYLEWAEAETSESFVGDWTHTRLQQILKKKHKRQKRYVIWPNLAYIHKESIRRDVLQSWSSRGQSHTPMITHATNYETTQWQNTFSYMRDSHPPIRLEYKIITFNPHYKYEVLV